MLDMRRCELLTLIGGVAAWPVVARAQQRERMRRIGILMTFAADDLEGRARVTAFMQALQQRGWADGRNVRIDARWGLNDGDLRKFAAELVELAPDVILTSSSVAVAAMLQATRTIPIVFTIVADPVGAGYVDSLARPGGNATGFTIYEYSMSGKWLELLKAIAPGVTRAVVLRDPAVASGPGQFAAIQAVAPSLGVELRPVNVRDAGEIERAIATFAQSANGGFDRDRKHGGGGSSRTHYRPGGSASVTCGLQQPLLGFSRRPDVLWTGFPRPVPARSRLCRSHPQGREASRPAGAGADQIRVGHQPQDREGAWARSAGQAARARRRGDRMNRRGANGWPNSVIQSRRRP
jgi:hypothetical protein